jgi:hypothetical protein
VRGDKKVNELVSILPFKDLATEFSLKIISLSLLLENKQKYHLLL